MNFFLPIIFRVSGDSTHIFARLFLLGNILKNKSYSGISAKSQLMFSILFIARFTHPIYLTSQYLIWNMMMSISMTLLTFFLAIKYADTYDKQNDCFSSSLLYVQAMLFTFFMTKEFETIEMLWIYSEYLEAMAIIPQIYMIFKTGQITKAIIIYLVFLALYKFLYCWLWVYESPCVSEIVSKMAGILYIVIYFVSLLLLRFSGVTLKNEETQTTRPNIYSIQNDYENQQSVTPYIVPPVEKNEIV